MSPRRKFLVTAATTPLGRSVCRRLASVGEVFAVRAPADPPADVDQDVARTADLTHSADVRGVLAGLVAEESIDTIVHVGSTVPARAACPAPNALSTRLLLDGAAQLACVRAVVLRSTALLYRRHHDDPRVITEQHPLELSPSLSAAQRDRLEADLTACQRALSADFRVSVLRLSPLVAEGSGDGLSEYLRSDPCYRALGFDPMVNVLSLDDAADALGRAAQCAPRGVFNVGGADTLPFSELAARIGARCSAVPGPLIESLCALRRLPERDYRGLGGLLHHGLVVDRRAAAAAFGFTASKGIE